MPLTPADLAKRAKIKNGEVTPEVTQAFEVARTMLDDALAGAFRDMPEHVYDECHLSVGYAVLDRSKSSDGARQQVVMEGQQPVRSPRDPLASVRSILANYTGAFA